MNRYDVIVVGGGRTLALARPFARPPRRERRSNALKGCVSALRGIRARVRAKLSTEELRDAVRAPGRIAGRAGVKEVLDAVLAGFCIGK